MEKPVLLMHSLIGIFEGVEQLLKEGYIPQRTIYFIFGHDEENSGKDGAAKIAQTLMSRGLYFDFILDEGLTVTEGVDKKIPVPVAFVGTSEKGHLTVELSVETKGGHSSMPPKNTAIGILSTAITAIESNPIPAKLEGPSKYFLQTIGPLMKFPTNIFISNLWLFERLAIWIMRKTPIGNAIVGTTVSVNKIEGGFKENVVPNESKALINLRIAPYHTPQYIIDYLNEIVNDKRVKIKPLGTPINPSPVTDHNSDSFRILRHAILREFPGVMVIPNLMIGNTDTRWFWNLTKHIYRFTPTEMKSQRDVDRFHGTNERISLSNYQKVLNFYYHIIQDITH